MATAKHVLEPRLAEVLSEVRIDVATHSAVVGGHVVESDDIAELERRLADQLYAVFHTGLGSADTRNTYPKRERRLERALAEVVPHRTTPINPILRQVEEELLVEWDGVLVWLPRTAAEEGDLPPVDEQIQMYVPPVRPAVSPGFQLVTGSSAAEFTGSLLRVYVHITDPESAVGAWRNVLSYLERDGVTYQAKVSSRTREYPRRDALVVYLPQASAPASRLISEAVQGLQGIGDSTSVFAERLAPGVARAWEPTDNRFGMSGLSFGQHRCRVLARALVDSAVSAEPCEAAVTSAFLEANIDPENPAVNVRQDG